MRQYVRDATQALAPTEIEGALTRKKTRVAIKTPIMIGNYKVITEMHPFKYKNGHGTIVSNFSNAIDFKYTTDTGRRGIKIYCNGRVQVSGFKSEDEIVESSKEFVRQIIHHFREGPTPPSMVHQPSNDGDEDEENELLNIVQETKQVEDFLHNFPFDLDLDVSDLPLPTLASGETSSGEGHINPDPDMWMVPSMEEYMQPSSSVTVQSCETVLYNAMWRLAPPGSPYRINFQSLIAYCSVDTMDFTAHYNAEHCAPRMTLQHRTHLYKLVISVKGSVMYSHKNGSYIQSAADLLQQVIQSVQVF